ncbi:MAG: septation ring formation regulator EzrA [Arthrobacter sp.]|nr:septation ring formation regulator EzrA [Arthrobacter sp.]
MATRRPKVPRATPAAPKSPDTGDGGDVIQADFGGRPAQAHAAAPASGSRHDSPRQDAGRATPGKAAPQSSPARTATAPNRDAKSSGTRSTGTQASAPKASGVRTKAARASGAGKAPAEAEEAPVPAKAFSGRMLALSVVMIAITIMLAPTVKIFFEKRAEIAALQADISEKQSQQNDLRRQVSRWQDPSYVKQQARDRINMVMPGETGYWVFGSDLPAGETGGAAGAATSQDPAKLPWVDTLWESIRRSATD